MSQVSSTVAAPRPDPWWHRWRLPLLFATLGVILYYTAFIYFLVPYYGFMATWEPDNVLTVSTIPAGREAAPHLRPGDQILAIDGIPARQRLWQPLFAAGKTEYEYTIGRAGQQFIVTIPVEQVTVETWLEVVQNRTTIGLVALSFWLVGAAVILFATPQNQDAWLLGLVTVGTAVVLAASEGALYNAPGGWLLSNLAFPFLAVLLLRLAFLPRQQPLARSIERVFRVLYGGASLLAVLAAYELFYLVPIGSSFETETGLSLYGILLLALAVGMLANIGVLLWRLFRMPPSYTRQQILIVVIFTALAIVPGQILTFYPWLLFDSPVLSWALATLMLALIPAGYAYVIYRRRYLQLDIFMTHGLTVFIVISLFAVGYSLGTYVLRDTPILKGGNLFSGLILVPLLFVVPYTSRPARRAVQTLLYGSQLTHRERLTDFSSRLAAQPEAANLQTIFRETLKLLQVRKAVLMLAANAEVLVSVDEVRVDKATPLLIRDLALPIGTAPCLSHNRDLSRINPAFAGLPWLEAIVPLMAGGQPVGLLLLGQPIPDGYFNARDVGFLQQLGDTMAVAALNIHLFESSRAMSRKLLQVRDAERLYLASQIHDQPLQQVSYLANELERLSSQVDDSVAEMLRQHSRALSEVAAELRTTCSGLYPPVRQQGIQWAIREAVYNFRRQGNCQVELNVDLAAEVIVSVDVATSAYHVLVEALNNIGKHARATRAWVRLYQHEDCLCLQVEDDGECDESTFLSIPDLLRGQHYGLAGMHEWADAVNGELVISRRFNGGTTIRLIIPPPWREG